MNSYLLAWKKYIVFEGRSPRLEYFAFFIGNGIIAAVIAIAQNITGVEALRHVAACFLLATILPGIAVNIRRLHDIDRSGWWILISLVPIVGSLILLIFNLLDSYPGENRFGPNPKLK
jgi:uncharacterized membrane protein YhaH (DUF805 family)